MKNRTVTIEIDERGESTIDLKGFEGQGCGDVTDALRGADTVKEARKKREYYFEAAAARKHRQQS